MPSHTVETPTPDDSLVATATRAFGWSFLNTAVSRLGTLTIGIVLARLLGPEEFGTFAVATVALLAVLSFNELGVSLAIVRWQGDPARIAPTVTTLSVASSLILTVLMYVAAPSFSAAMGDPEASDVVRLMSLSILVNGAVATPAALLQRDFRQGRRMVVDQVNTWLGAAISLTLALAGWGAMSLAIGRVVGSVVAAVLFIAWSPLPYRFGFERSEVRSLLRFGLPLAGASVVVFAGAYADQLIVGSMLGAKQLGFYVLAFNLASWPVSIFSQPLRSVAPAAFSRLQTDQPAMQGAFVTLARLLALVALPVCVMLAAAAGPIVRLVYGTVWSPAAAILTFLAIAAGARIIFELVYDFLVVCGRSRSILLAQAGWLLLLLPCLVLGARLAGSPGVAIAQVLVAIFAVAPVYALLLSRTGVAIGSVVRVLWLPVLASLVLACAIKALTVLFDSSFLVCLTAGLLGVLCILTMLWRARPVLIEVKRLTAQRTAS